MTPGQQRIATYIMENPSDIIKHSITELARYAGVKSEASVVRFYRMLGFSGYKDFKIQIAQELASRTFYHSHEDINIDDTTLSIKEKIFRGAVSALDSSAQRQTEAVYETACKLIDHANRIIFLGYAASAAMCYYAHFRFINPLIRIAHKEVSTILITGTENSTLGSLAYVVLLTRAEEQNLVTDAMSSRVAQLCTIDALFSMVSLQRGEDALSRLRTTRSTFLTTKR